MKLHINATRMELLKLRGRLNIAVRGHKLLNDKLEGLMREFLSLIKKYKKQRIFIDNELPGIIKLFILARITSSKDRIMTALEQSKISDGFALKQKRVLNIPIPYFSIINSSENKDSSTALSNGIAYSLLDTNSDLDNALTLLKNIFPDILKLAALEQSVRVVAKEIGKTRKRVNALEFRIIPQLKEDIAFIRNKLDEIERSNISRIMKIKEILGKR